MREESTPELVGLKLRDVAGPAADDLWLLAEKAPQTSVPTPLLFHFDGGGWQRHDLWRWTPFESLEVDAERGTLWLDTVPLPIAELPLQPESQPSPGFYGGTFSAFLHRGLWIGRDEVWLTSSEQAVHRKR